MEVQRIGFTSAKNKRISLYDIANKTDEDIIKESYAIANSKVEKSHRGKLLQAFPAVAVLTLAALGACSKPGKLSSKLSAAIHSLASFAFVSAIFDFVDDKFKAGEEKSKTLKKMNENNPFLSSIGKIAVSIALTSAGFKGIRKLMPTLSKQFPKLKDDFVKMSKNTKKIIDDSKFGKMAEDVKQNYSKFKMNNPKTAKFISKNAFPLTVLSYLAGSLGLSYSVSRKTHKEAVEAAKTLTQLRQDAKDSVASNGGAPESFF